MRHRQSKADKALDRQIDAIFRANCSGIQIDMMDISKIFAAGKAAAAAGADIQAAVLSTVAALRKN